MIDMFINKIYLIRLVVLGGVSVYIKASIGCPGLYVMINLSGR